MLYLIGIGLSDPEDVTVRGLELIRSSARVFLDAYTSILSVGKDRLEEFYGRPVELADRDLVEQGDVILAAAQSADVSFLVVGDPLGATTHADLAMRARQRGVAYRVVHNASVLTAVASCGLQLYTFGETVSVPFWDAVSRPSSFLDKLLGNWERNLHTLCLLDIRVREPTMESLLRGRPEFEPPRRPRRSSRLTPDEEVKRRKIKKGPMPAKGVDLVALQMSLHALPWIVLSRSPPLRTTLTSWPNPTPLELRNRLNRRKQLPPPERLLTVGLARLGSPDERIAACSLADMASARPRAAAALTVVPAPRLTRSKPSSSANLPTRATLL
uniref:diphthine methyl ester synthase n=1 Tax=Macrostomum lignano TaxID=282301 RepID=A0A1I8JMX4_9PLAT